MLKWVLLALFAVLGVFARTGLALQFNRSGAEIPWGTFAANLIGCFFSGSLFFWVQQNQASPWGFALSFGLSGGLTTFSTLNLEFFILLQKGHYWLGGAYVLSSVILGLFAVIAGYSVMQMASTT